MPPGSFHPRIMPFSAPPGPEPPPPENLIPDLAVKALMVEMLPGRLSPAVLSRRERMVIRAFKAAEGDFRDFAAIGDYADAIAARLSNLDAPSSEAQAGALL